MARFGRSLALPLIKLEKAFASMVRNHRFSRASLKLGGGDRGAGFRLLNHEIGVTAARPDNGAQLSQFSFAEVLISQCLIRRLP